MGGIYSQDEFDKFVNENITLPQEKSSSAAFPWYADVDVDWNSCRKFRNLPPIGEHPRLFFTKEELPRIIARFTHSSIGPDLKQILKNARNNLVNKIDLDRQPNLSETEKINPMSKETIDLFFKGNEQRNVDLLGAYVYGIVFGDQDAADRAKRYAVFYAKVILKSKQIAIEQNIRTKPYGVWHTNEWNVPFQFLIGGSSFAFLYDLIYNDISEEDREIIRSAIILVLENRKPWGMGWATRRIQSNWSCYHGDFYNFSAVVEGEGLVENQMPAFQDLMVHFLEYGIYDSGHPVEDAYAVNLALREGSLCFFAMARRGYNVFNHPHYKKIWTNWLPYALEPHNSGKIYGGSSGCHWMYPTSAILAKFMFPKDPIIDYVYRHFMNEDGKNYHRLNKMQCRITALTFAIPSSSLDDGEPETPKNLNLDCDFICRDRGKVIMRSDWTKTATCFTFDSRPDAFLVGHDTCSRGAFVLNAGKRNWGHCPEWNSFQKCSDFSLPLIDNEGQQNKAPFVKLMSVVKKESFTYACADLTYAYNWRWENVGSNRDMSAAGFEREPNDPRDFGFNVWWSPHKLYDEKDVGFNGLHIWRKRIATVSKVMRSSIMVRGKTPFVIVADDLEKDNGEHEYTWAMTMPADVSLEGFDGNQAVLKDEREASTRLIVRNVSFENKDLTCQFREIEGDPKRPHREIVNQIQFRCRRRSVKFRFMMYATSAEKSGELNCTLIKSDGESSAKVHDADANEEHHVHFRTGEEGQTEMWVDYATL